MSIKSINNICLYTYLKPITLEGRIKPAFPMIALLEGRNMVAAIRVRFGDGVCHVENVVAEKAMGPLYTKR